MGRIASENDTCPRSPMKRSRLSDEINLLQRKIQNVGPLIKKQSILNASNVTLNETFRRQPSFAFLVPSCLLFVCSSASCPVVYRSGRPNRATALCADRLLSARAPRPTAAKYSYTFRSETYDVLSRVNEEDG